MIASREEREKKKRKKLGTGLNLIFDGLGPQPQKIILFLVVDGLIFGNQVWPPKIILVYAVSYIGRQTSC